MIDDKTQLLQKIKQQANHALTNNFLDLAIQFYNKAIQIESNDYILYNLRSNAYFMKQLYFESLKDANSSININPVYLKSIIIKIQSLILLDQLNKANQSIIDAIDLTGSNLQLSNLMLKLQKRLEKQRQLYQKNAKQINNQNQMIKWLKSSPSNSFNKFKIKYFNQGFRGVIARSKILKKQRVLFIHKSYMITLEMAKIHPLCKKLLNKNVQLLSPKHTYLSIYLLDQKRKLDSFWKSYINLLPIYYRNFPIFYDESQLKQLQGSTMIHQIKQKVYDLKKDYQLICSIQPTFSNITFKQFCWARITVCSRIFGLVINGCKTDALVPYADMLNHKIPKQTSWSYSQQSEGFVIQAIEEINLGQQIFDSYGRKCNSRFLLNYGFVLKDNDANQIIFKFELNEKYPLSTKKLEMIHQRQRVKIFRVTKNIQDNNFIQMFGYLRFINIKDSQKLKILINISKQDQFYRPIKTPALDILCELNAWKYFQLHLKECLKNYGTSLQQDQKLLQNQNFSENKKNCILLRMGQKQLYLYLLKISQKMIDFLLNNKNWKFKQQIKAEYKQCYGYLKKIIFPLIQAQ